MGSPVFFDKLIVFRLKMKNPALGRAYSGGLGMRIERERKLAALERNLNRKADAEALRN